MDARRAKQVEGQDRLREEAIPFRHWKIGVNGAERGYEMIFEGPDSAFGSIGAMFFGGYALKGDVVFRKGIFDFVGAFIVKNVKIGRMTVLNEFFVNRLPSIANAGSLAIGNGDSMNGVGIVVVEHKNVVVTATGRNRKAAGLIGVGLDEVLFVEEKSEELMTGDIKRRFEVGIRGQSDGNRQ